MSRRKEYHQSPYSALKHTVQGVGDYQVMLGPKELRTDFSDEGIETLTDSVSEFGQDFRSDLKVKPN
jgi:hypothetical protein